MREGRIALTGSAVRVASDNMLRGENEWRLPHRAVGLLARIGLRKSVAQIQQETATSELKRSLGPWNLVFLGIGCIIGAGIFVRTGNAAALHAGPAVLISYVIAGIICAFAGLCYAELASTLPVSGSAYTYSYATIGEFAAWVMGALLLLEYGLAASVVAVGWSGYMVSLLSDIGRPHPRRPDRADWATICRKTASTCS